MNCRTCKSSENEFHDRHVICKECFKVKCRDYYKRHSDVNRKAVLKKKFGITFEKYIEMKCEQNGLCKICRGISDKMDLAVDHDHKTGKIRGLLCNNCNNGIGRFMDSVSILNSAAKYLENAGE